MDIIIFWLARLSKEAVASALGGATRGDLSGDKHRVQTNTLAALRLAARPTRKIVTGVRYRRGTLFVVYQIDFCTIRHN